jgi:hypothetical protein
MGASERVKCIPVVVLRVEVELVLQPEWCFGAALGNQVVSPIVHQYLSPQLEIGTRAGNI